MNLKSDNISQHKYFLTLEIEVVPTERYLSSDTFILSLISSKRNVRVLDLQLKYKSDRTT